MSYTSKIVFAMAAGILLGGALGALAPVDGAVFDVLVRGVFNVVGRIFVNLLQMMVVPLVLVSLVCGVRAIGDLRTLGRVGGKTFGLYLATTAIAVVLALLVATTIGPGASFELAGEVAYEARPAPPLANVLIDMFPSNPFMALADGRVLQVIVFALLFGFALTLCGEAGKRIGEMFEDLNTIVMRMVLMVIKIAPIGVFALVAETFATQGFGIFGSLLSYFLTVAFVLALQLVLTYPLLLKSVGLSPIRFLGKMRAVMTFAFSTSSSSATIPLTLNTVEKRLGVSNSVAAFTVPLGATVNMDGTAIMQGVATVFVANVYGVDLGLGDFMTVILTATLASIGTAAVPSAGLIMLAMVLGQVGLPVQAIGLIIGIDRLLDMMRTAVNVTGDSAVTCVVAKTEHAMDMSVFDDPEATIDSPVPASVHPHP